MASMMCILRNQSVVDVPKECAADCIYLSNNGRTCAAPFVFRKDRGGHQRGKYVPPPVEGFDTPGDRDLAQMTAKEEFAPFNPEAEPKVW